MTLTDRLDTFDARWRVIAERINRSVGQHARHAHAEIRALAQRHREEIAAESPLGPDDLVPWRVYVRGQRP